MANNTEITKVRIIIRHLLWQTRTVVTDPFESQKWLARFRNTLQYQNLEEDPDKYALAILAEARSFNDAKKRNGQMKWVRESLAEDGIKNPTQEQLDERWLQMYGQESPQDAPTRKAGDEPTDTRNGATLESATSCDQLMADGDIREDSLNIDTSSNGSVTESGTSANTFTADGDIREDSLAKQDGSAITRNETRYLDAFEPSANHYATRQAKNGDAATREGADESTTVSRNMRRVPQNEAPAHGFSGGRTAQGTMSRSPEAAAQSGKASALDSLPDKDGQSAKTRDTRASVRYAPPSCSPEDGNHYDQDASISTDNPQPEGLTGPSHGGSVASLEARQSQASESQGRAGADSVRGTPLHRAPARSSGRKFRNKEEFMGWAIDSGLDPVDASECWDATEERGGRDADGNHVKNMKAFAAQWCRTRSNNRRTA